MHVAMKMLDDASTPKMYPVQDCTVKLNALMGHLEPTQAHHGLSSAGFGISSAQAELNSASGSTGVTGQASPNIIYLLFTPHFRLGPLNLANPEGL
jgi:hypothetical protein